jgi:hypothetical protein
MNPLKLEFVTPFFKIVTSTSAKVYLGLHVTRLQIANSNGHYFAVDKVIGGKP